MTGPATTFYIPTGTLPKDALCYVYRQADELLYAGLMQSQFCYILTSRQMGKSSLMAHTAERMQNEGAAVAVLDLSAIGYDLNAEQWYVGLLDQLGRRLRLEDELDDFLLDNEHLSLLQIWHRALRDVVLKHCSGRVVIFLDEIDIVRSLPFSTDEFFAAIRACYNARTEDPAYERLTFCLLGVANRADLIRNPRLTPFNIGKPIDLHDFTAKEAALLEIGLGHDNTTNHLLMERIIYWTGGHPCLTQKMCKVIAEDGAILNSSGVDRCCRELFLAPQFGSQDDNLLFVQQRLMPEAERREGEQQETWKVREEEERAALLTLYSQVLAGQPVADNDTAAMVSQLKLSGVVKSEHGFLQVRNRIYRHVFDRAWIIQHMPDAELRRQKRAFQRGVVRAASVATALISVLSALVVFAWVQTLRLRASERQNRLDLYVADVSQAQPNADEDNFAEVRRLLSNHYPERDGTDWRGFEWRYLWRLLHQDQHTLRGHTDIVFSLAYSPDGRTVATGGFDRTLIFWDARTGNEVFRLPKQDGAISALAFSRTKNELVMAISGSSQGQCEIASWDIALHKKLWSLSIPATFIPALAFSHNGRLMAAECVQRLVPHEILLWEVSTRKRLARMPVSASGDGNCLAFSPDDRLLAMPYDSRSLQLWEVKTKRRVRTLPVDSKAAIHCIAFSPNGRYLAAGMQGGQVYLWSTNTWQRLLLLQKSQDAIHSVTFSPDSARLAAAGWDDLIHLWSIPGGKYSKIRGHTNRVNAVAFSPDGRMLASGSSDTSVKLWNLRDALQDRPDALRTPESMKMLPPLLERSAARRGAGGEVHFQDNAIEPMQRQAVKYVGPNSGNGLDEQTFAAISRQPGKAPLNTWRFWNVGTLRQTALVSDVPETTLFALASDGRTIALHDPRDTKIKLKNCRTGQVLDTLPASTGEISLAFSPDNTTLASTVLTNKVQKAEIRLWNPVTRQEIGRIPLQEPDATLTGVIKYSPDSRFLLAGWFAPGRHFALLWDLVHHRLVKNLPMPENSLLQAAFSPEDKYLAISDWAGPVVIWNLNTLREVTRLRPHRQYTTALGFSADGKTLATGGKDGVIKLWNTATWREILRFPAQAGHAILLCTLVSTPDGERLVGVTEQGVRVWKAASPSEIEAREEREGGNLSQF